MTAITAAKVFPLTWQSVRMGVTCAPMRSGEALTVRVGAIAAGLVLALATPAAATTIVVETDVDEFGAGGTSACTLREAVEAARTNDSFGGCAAGSDKDRIEMPGSVVLQRPEAGGTNAGGDLDYNANEKLTIIGAETFTSSPPQIDVAPAWSDRVLEATKGTVTLRGIEISDIESGEAAGGAVLATGENTALKMQDVVFHDNSAIDRGGAVACEFCKTPGRERELSVLRQLDHLARDPARRRDLLDGAHRDRGATVSRLHLRQPEVLREHGDARSGQCRRMAAP